MRDIEEPKIWYFQLYNTYNKYRKKVILVSYPKSGRTWLQYMLNTSINLCGGNKHGIRYYYWKLSVPLLVPTHDGTGDVLGGDKSYLDIKWEMKYDYRKERVIFLIRDPRDVVVSYYFHRKKRSHPKIRFNGTIQEFIRSEYYGVKNIISFYNMWHSNMHMPKDFLLVRYEDMHKSPREALKAVLDFYAKLNVSEKIIDRAIRLSSFENMRKKEMGNAELNLRSKILRPIDINDPESYKVRQGKIGKHTDYLNEDDIEFLNEEINNRLSDFYWFYKS